MNSSRPSCASPSAKPKAQQKHIKDFPTTTASIVEIVKMIQSKRLDLNRKADLDLYDYFCNRYWLPIKMYLIKKIRSELKKKEYKGPILEAEDLVSMTFDEIKRGLRTYQFGCELRGIIAKCAYQVVLSQLPKEIPHKTKQEEKTGGAHRGKSVFPGTRLDEPIPDKNSDGGNERTVQDSIPCSSGKTFLDVKDHNYRVALIAAALVRACVEPSWSPRRKEIIRMIIGGEHSTHEICNAVQVTQQAVSQTKIALYDECKARINDYKDDRLWFEAPGDYEVNIDEVLDEIRSDVEAELKSHE